MSAGSPERQISIDGLRGIAAVSVATQHILPEHPIAPLDIGRVGVLLFFLLSGYCIALSLAASRPRPLVDFAIRRIFRLYPLYWLSIIAVALAFRDGSPLSTYVINFTMLQTTFGVPDVSGVYWTLFIELIFYGVVAILLVLGLARSLPAYLLLLVGVIAVVLAAAALRWTTGLAVPYAHALFVSLFLLGALTSLIDAESPGRPPLFYGGVLIYLAAIAVISWLVFGDRRIGSETAPGHLTNYVLACALFLLFSRPLRLRFTWLAYLGTVSYGIYLLHVVVLEVLLWSGLVEGYGWLVRATVFFGATLVCAAIAHHALEKPCIGLGKRLSAAVGTRSRGAGLRQSASN